jgi:hypothetical protein
MFWRKEDAIADGLTLNEEPSILTLRVSSATRKGGPAMKQDFLDCWRKCCLVRAV